MIDQQNGVLIFENGFTISPSLTEELFLDSELGKAATKEVINVPWRSYRIESQKISGETFAVVLYFHREVLQSVHLANMDERFGISWSDWSEEKEMSRNRSHESWLKKIIGMQRIFGWGYVWSGYDSKAGSSSIVINYKNSSPSK